MFSSIVRSVRGASVNKVNSALLPTAFSGARQFHSINHDVTQVTCTELLGDGIGPELSQAIHRIADVLPVDFKFEQVDWSLERRKVDPDYAITEAFNSMDKHKLAIKYPTITATDLPGTAGRSPNALIRRKCNFSVIYRPAISIQGINTNFKDHVNMHIVRIATGGTYDDPGQMIGEDAAVSIRMVERKPCLQAAKFAFDLARRRNWTMTSASKHTIQKVTDGFFEEMVASFDKDYPDVTHNVELFDALLGKAILKPESYEVVVCLNEYGDFLSDMASGLVGSLGTGASGNYSFDDEGNVNIAMFDPAGGTAPDIAGQNKANPTAIFLAFGMLLDHVGRYDLGHALRLATLDSIRLGKTTGDLGGNLTTSEFTDLVVSELPKFVNTKAKNLAEFYGDEYEI
jgi:isocitrate dehydrogenase (NAD+)